MTHDLEIRHISGANLNDICEKVIHYQNNYLGLISHGKAFPRRYVLSNGKHIFIWHTLKKIIVEKI